MKKWQEVVNWSSATMMCTSRAADQWSCIILFYLPSTKFRTKESKLRAEEAINGPELMFSSPYSNSSGLHPDDSCSTLPTHPVKV